MGKSPKTTKPAIKAGSGFKQWRPIAESNHGPEHYQNNLPTRIKNLKEDEDKESEADPFTSTELEKIELLKTEGYYRPQAINMFLFQTWTGLSFSEQMAVAWEDVDTVNWTLTVRRARVADEYKVPKEPSRNRTIDLLQPAIDILKEQLKLTHDLPAEEFDVRRRNNVTTCTENLRCVFRNEAYECADGIWRKRAVQGAYGTILKKAGVRHRGVNQCRHTFASMLLTKYVPIDLVAVIMGHTNSETTKKHYAKIIPEDRPNVAKIISGIAGFEYKQECAEVHKKG